MIPVLLTLHVLAAVIWVGGMFFSYAVLRPVSASLEPQTIDAAQRLTLWAAIFKKFFPWVWACIVILLATGFVMISLTGGFDAAGMRVYVMLGLGVVMIGIFKFICVAPFKHLCRGVEEQKWEVAAFAMGTIRTLIATNLALGILTVLAAVGLRGLV